MKKLSSPPSAIIHPLLGWMYIISPNTRNVVAIRKGSVCNKLREWGGVGKAFILRQGDVSQYWYYGMKEIASPPIGTFFTSTRMNVYYISKHKKSCGEENGLRLLWIEDMRMGWQSIYSEAGGWIKGLVVGKKETFCTLPSVILYPPLGWM